MAIGDIVRIGDGNTSRIELLASAIATSAVPSGTVGLDFNYLRDLGEVPAVSSILVKSTAGSGTMTVTLRLWGYDGAAWYPVGPGSDSTKGVINVAAALGETDADSIRHSEVFNYPGLWQRLYLQVTAIGGTATAVTGYIVIRRGLGLS